MRGLDTLHPLPHLSAEIVNSIGRIAGEDEIEEEATSMETVKSSQPKADGQANGQPMEPRKKESVDLYVL